MVVQCECVCVCVVTVHAAWRVIQRRPDVRLRELSNKNVSLCTWGSSVIRQSSVKSVYC